MPHKTIWWKLDDTDVVLQTNITNLCAKKTMVPSTISAKSYFHFQKMIRSGTASVHLLTINLQDLNRYVP